MATIVQHSGAGSSANGLLSSLARSPRIAGLRDLPARTALRVANAPPVRRLLAARYQAAIERHRTHLPALDGLDAQIVSALHRDGVFVTTTDALAIPGAAEAAAAATALADDFAEEAHARVRAGIDFNVVPAATLRTEPGIFAWGLNDRVLAIAEAYLGLPIAYDGPSINYTVADGREVSTRKWHRDWEDRRMLKVAIYLNDVDAQGGPFQMVKRTDADRSEVNGYRYDLASDGQMSARLGADFRDAIVSCEGAAGTVIFTDTARFFHRGKPAVARDRKALFYSYFSDRPRHPFLCERSGLSRRDIDDLARDLTPQQRRVTAWRTRLPRILRLIPPARI